MKKFNGDILKVAILRRYKNIHRFAREHGFDQTNLIQMINGDTLNPRPKTVRKLARALGINPRIFHMSNKRMGERALRKWDDKIHNTYCFEFLMFVTSQMPELLDEISKEFDSRTQKL